MNAFDFRVSSVLFAYRRLYSPGTTLQMAGRQAHGLTLILQGTLKISFSDGIEAVANEGDIILQRLGDKYRLEALGDLPTDYVVISYLTEEADFPTAALPSCRVFSPTHRHRYRDAFLRAAETYGSPAVCGKTLLRALVQEILCHIINEHYTRALFDEDDPVKRAKFFIEESFDQSIGIPEISAAACCSPSYLRTLFRNAFGESPMHYLNRTRIEHAKEMISSNLFRMEEIATACGFQNVYYFSRVFKSYTGISPGKY